LNNNTSNKEAPSHIAGYGTGLEEITKPTRRRPDGSRVGRNYKFQRPCEVEAFSFQSSGTSTGN